MREPRRGTLIVAALAAIAVGLVLLAGEDGESAEAEITGSTLEGTWIDADGDGTLERGEPEPLLDRTELAPASAPAEELATIVQITDPHVRDEESPARASLLDRIDPDLNSTFRPQEALSPQVLAAVVEATNATAPDAVLLTGDLIDSAQRNELDQLIGTLAGGTVDPDSGAPGYEGPQEPENPDPFFYRPDLDAPTNPGLLEDAQEPFGSPGLEAPWHPLVGNHDLLVQGEVPSTPDLEALATGDRLLTGLRPGVRLPREVGAIDGGELADEAALSPELVDRVIGAGLPGPTDPISADRARRHLTADEAIADLREASGSGGTGPRMDYAFDVGPRVRVIALDLVNRNGGSGGVVDPAQPGWLRRALDRAGDRYVLVMTHQPIDGSFGGEALLAEIERDPDVIATLAGDTHSNLVEPHETAVGGYWEIETSSLADFPQQARALRVVATEAGGVAIETWMLDGAGSDLADTARELSYLDAQGGRPQGNAGEPADRNVRLYR